MFCVDDTGIMDTNLELVMSRYDERIGSKITDVA